MNTRHYLYRVRAGRPELLTDGPTPEEEGIMVEHFQWLHQQADQGTLIMAGRTLNDDETSFGIVIFKAASQEEARAVMQSAPAIKHGLCRAELFPYRIVLLNENNAEEK